jgi:hypothetical protein
MGLEAYLFNIEFEQPVNEEDIFELFDNIGMTNLKNKDTKRTEKNYGSYYFELRTDKGLSECLCIFSPADTALSEFSLRFSVISPRTVIEQTFLLLKKLNEICPINVYDTEIRNHIFRQMRKEEKVDKWFNRLEGTEENEEIIKRVCLIPIDAEIFCTTKLAIIKRKIVCKNRNGQIIESGTPTTNHIMNMGLYEKYLSWLENEL